jgi:hypothetical protein
VLPPDALLPAVPLSSVLSTAAMSFSDTPSFDVRIPKPISSNLHDLPSPLQTLLLSIVEVCVPASESNEFGFVCWQDFIRQSTGFFWTRNCVITTAHAIRDDSDFSVLQMRFAVSGVEADTERVVTLSSNDYAFRLRQSSSSRWAVDVATVEVELTTSQAEALPVLSPNWGAGLAQCGRRAVRDEEVLAIQVVRSDDSIHAHRKAGSIFVKDTNIVISKGRALGQSKKYDGMLYHSAFTTAGSSGGLVISGSLSESHDVDWSILGMSWLKEGNFSYAENFKTVYTQMGNENVAYIAEHRYIEQVERGHFHRLMLQAEADNTSFQTQYDIRFATAHAARQRLHEKFCSPVRDLGVLTGELVDAFVKLQKRHRTLCEELLSRITVEHLCCGEVEKTLFYHPNGDKSSNAIRFDKQNKGAKDAVFAIQPNGMPGKVYSQVKLLEPTRNWLIEKSSDQKQKNSPKIQVELQSFLNFVTAELLGCLTTELKFRVPVCIYTMVDSDGMASFSTTKPESTSAPRALSSTQRIASETASVLSEQKASRGFNFGSVPSAFDNFDDNWWELTDDQKINWFWQNFHDYEDHFDKDATFFDNWIAAGSRSVGAAHKPGRSSAMTTTSIATEDEINEIDDF